MRIVLALVVLLGIALLLWVREPAAPAAALDRSPAGATDAETAPEPAEATTVPRAPASANPKMGLLVRVVDGDGAPVPGAEVRHSLLEPRAEDGPRDARLWAYDRPAAAARFGAVLRADARGEAVIAVPDTVTEETEQAVYVCALDAGRLAEHWVPWSEARGDSVTLRLELDRGFDVLLLDHDDRPVSGVAIAARYRLEDELVGLRDAEHGLGTTDGGGLVQARHVQAWWDDVHAPDGVRRVVIAPILPGLSDAGTEVVLADPMPERVVLRVPPTGGIRIVVKGLSGDAARRRQVELAALDADGAVAERHAPRLELDANGEALFERVALLREWQVRLQPSAQAERFAGPRTPGEEVVHRIVAPREPVLVGRLVADGVPLADRAFAMSGRSEQMTPFHGGRTDADGRFRIERYPPEIDTRLEDLNWLVVDAEEARALAGTVTATPPLIAGDNDLGDVVLTEIPPLLTGRIVGDHEGVRLLCQAADDEGGWSVVRSVARTLAEDGAFALHGRAPDAPLRLVVHTPKAAPVAPIPFEPGQRDLVVTLTAGGGIAVEAVLGDERAFIMLAPRAVPMDARPDQGLLSMPGGRGLPEWDRAVPAQKESVAFDPLTLRYVWKGVPPGRYRIEFRAWDFGGAAREIHDVVVRAGEETTLERVDLRDAIRYVTLRFPDLDRPDRHARLAAQGLGSYGYLFVVGPEGTEGDCISIDGYFEFLALTQPLDVLVEAPGFRRKLLRGVDEDLEVRLEPGLPVELELGEPFDAPADGTVIVTLTPRGDIALPREGRTRSRAAGGVPGHPRTFAAQCTRDGDTFRAVVTTPGTYELGASLRLATGRTRPLRVTPERLTVGPERGSGTITLAR